MSENNFPHADYGLALGLRIRADCSFRMDCRITDSPRHGDNLECAQVVGLELPAICWLAEAVGGRVPWREGSGPEDPLVGVHRALRRAQGWPVEAGHPVAAFEQ